jgi:protein-disulfide isomerase
VPVMFKKIALVLLALFLVAPGALKAAEPASFTDAQKTELRNLMKDYIKDNPDLIVQALQAYQQKQEDEIRAMAENRIKDNVEAVTGKHLPSVGPENADVTVTEFYDYNCGYCKHATEDILKIIEKDKNVRFVFIDLAVLGPASEMAAHWSHASHRQGKFFEFHTALMKNNEPRTDENLAKIAKQVGLDVDKLRLDATSPEIQQDVAKNRQLASELQIQGTPGFIINGKLFRGYIGLEGMEKAIKEAREKNKKSQ